MSDTSIPQRTCTKCKQSFPATLEHFHYQKNGKYSLSSWCITCHRERNKKNTAKLRENPEYKEAQRLYDKQHYQDKRNYCIEHNHKYYAENHEKELERTRIKYKAKFDQYRPQRLKHGREHYQEHKDEIAKIKSKTHALRMANDPDYVILRRAYHHKRRSFLRNASGTHTPQDILQLFEDQNELCAYCGIRIFWNIKGDIHLDHIDPISRGGSNWPDNLCLSCADCNLSKADKTPAEWIATRGW